MIVYCIEIILMVMTILKLVTEGREKLIVSYIGGSEAT